MEYLRFILAQQPARFEPTTSNWYVSRLTTLLEGLIKNTLHCDDGTLGRNDMRKTKKAGFEPVTLQLIGHLPLSCNLCPELIIAFCLLRKVNETNQTTSASFSDAAGKRLAWLP